MSKGKNYKRQQTTTLSTMTKKNVFNNTISITMSTKWRHLTKQINEILEGDTDQHTQKLVWTSLKLI